MTSEPAERDSRRESRAPASAQGDGSLLGALAQEKADARVRRLRPAVALMLANILKGQKLTRQGMSG